MAQPNPAGTTPAQGASRPDPPEGSGPKASGAGPRCSEPFKADAVRLVTHERDTIARGAAAVGGPEKSLRDRRRRQTRTTSPSQASGHDGSTEAENRRRREQLRRMEMERDALKKAATFFAHEATPDSPSSQGKR
jgi:transposase